LPEGKKLPLSIFSSSGQQAVSRGRRTASRGDLAISGVHRAIGFLAGFILTLLAVTAGVSELRESLPLEERDFQGEAYENASVAERYVLAPDSKRTVIVGSSVAKGLPPEGFRPQDVATLFIPGSGAMTGLEIILRSGARPQVVLVEVDFADRGVDDDLISHVFDPARLALRKAMPMFQEENNLLNLLAKASIPHRTTVADRPSMTVAEWRMEIRSRIDYYVSGFSNTYEPDQNLLARLQAQVKELGAHGARVVFFFDPLDPDIATAPQISKWRPAVQSAFPDHQFIPAADSALHLLDGIHFFRYAGIQYFEYLLGEADAELDDGRIPGLVRVKQATFGGNCGGLPGNLTYTARRLCLGGRSCDIGVDRRILDDRVVGCDKDLVVRWSCSLDTTERVSTLALVKAGDRLSLSCAS
jgi:hypothetical protein